MTKKQVETEVATDLHTLGEFGLIGCLARGIKDDEPGVVLGVGDDAAALEISPGHLILATCDSQVEGIHFRLDYATPGEIGQRAAAVNLSDIAAMGGNPRFALVSLAVPERISSEMLVHLYEGLRAVFSKWHTTIVGGNTAATPGPFTLDITVLGEGRPSQILKRSGARSGDVLCVTGFLGASRAGLAMLKHRAEDFDNDIKKQGLVAYRTPVPRVDVGRLLAESGVVTACMDVSDGLAGDVRHLSSQSKVCIEVDLEKLPVAEAARDVALFEGRDPSEYACVGGEDFELLFTAPPREADAVAERVRAETGVAVTIIGRITEGNGVVFTAKGKPLPRSFGGYEHFTAPV